MSYSLGGTNWEFTHGFAADEELVRSASLQALLMSHLPDGEFLEDVRYEITTNLTVKRVQADRLLANPRAAAFFSELLRVHDLNNMTIGSNEPVFYINRYDSGGDTGEHVDSIGSTTTAVGLSGVAEAVVVDPGTEHKHKFLFHPGDALRFYGNDGPEAERPLHVVRNILPEPRLAIVTQGFPKTAQ